MGNVLILVLVEDGFRGKEDYFSRNHEEHVLILVLVEDGFRGGKESCYPSYYSGLNPCSCGRWLQRSGIMSCSVISGEVLILVLVEDGFRETISVFRNNQTIVLILVLVEDGFRAGLKGSQFVDLHVS